MDKYNKFLKKFKDARTPTWFWNGKYPLSLSKELINDLENFSENEKTNCRICIHTNPEELCQVMLIVERKGMNIPPHFHKNKSDFVFVLKGEMEFYTFDKSSGSNDVKNLLPYNGFKSPPGMVHAIGIKSEKCTYLETSTGPFIKDEDAIYPSWAHEWHKKFYMI